MGLLCGLNNQTCVKHLEQNLDNECSINVSRFFYYYYYYSYYIIIITTTIIQERKKTKVRWNSQKFERTPGI